jgi:hypothetical protein
LSRFLGFLGLVMDIGERVAGELFNKDAGGSAQSDIIARRGVLTLFQGFSGNRNT